MSYAWLAVAAVAGFLLGSVPPWLIYHKSTRKDPDSDFMLDHKMEDEYDDSQPK